MDVVQTSLCEVEATVAPRLRLPLTLGGHVVRSDAQADLLYVLGLLASAGVDEVTGRDVRSVADAILLDIRPDEVEGFFSYRVAEAVRRLGGLAELSAKARDHAVRASDSSRLLRAAATGALRRRTNYRVVAARCVHERRSLGLPVDPHTATAIHEQVLTLFRTAHRGWIDDGLQGELHFDIYSPEMHLLAEPFKDRLDPHWTIGLTALLEDLAAVGHRGGVVTWGRSVGPLAIAMALKVAVLAMRHDLWAHRDRYWQSVAGDAAADLRDWFASGLVTAHQSRTSDPYRGPRRRLQLTFDLLGKMAWSAVHLPADCLEAGDYVSARTVNALLPFPGGAALWAYRSQAVEFTLPLMRGTSAEYLPTPRAPGLFEQPVGGLPLLIPTLVAPDDGSKSVRWVPDGPPVLVRHAGDAVDVHQREWVALGEPGRSPDVEGRREASMRVDGRCLTVSERLHIRDAPAGTVLMLAAGDTPQRRLRLDVVGLPQPTTVATNGMAEWQTHWSEIQRVHESSIAVAPGTEITFTWNVTPDLVAAAVEPDHLYSQLLYGHVRGVTVRPLGAPDDGLRRRLRGIDVVHVAWPERWPGVDIEKTERVIGQIKDAGAAIVWTQHNLMPHRNQSDTARRTYELWAEAADGVIHHTHYGRRRALATYHFPNAEHFVIPHGHWGPCFPSPAPERRAVEDDEGWPAAPIRLAIVGQPRKDKALQQVVEAFHRSGRDDMQLVARLPAQVRVPNDDRIVLLDGHASTERYYRRLTAVDGIILPFNGSSMLATGTAFDCIGGGLAPIAAPWEFLQETFGDAAIWYAEHSLTRCLETLTREALESAGMAVRALQANHRWEEIGSQTAEAFEDVVARG